MFVDIVVDTTETYNERQQREKDVLPRNITRPIRRPSVTLIRTILREEHSIPGEYPHNKQLAPESASIVDATGY